MLEFQQLYIIFDALDESIDRTELIAILSRIASWKLERSHILVISRKERDIQSLLETIVDAQNIICLQSALVDKNIMIYVRQSLSDDKS
jgi:hypothetical protein